MEFYAELDPANEVRAMSLPQQAFHVWKVLHSFSLGPACGPIPAAVLTYWHYDHDTPGVFYVVASTGEQEGGKAS